MRDARDTGSRAVVVRYPCAFGAHGSDRPTKARAYGRAWSASTVHFGRRARLLRLLRAARGYSRSLPWRCARPRAPAGAHDTLRYPQAHPVGLLPAPDTGDRYSVDDNIPLGEEFDSEAFGALPTPRTTGGEQLTLALLEDVAAILHRHGYPPLRGYALAELTASLYRLQNPWG